MNKISEEGLFANYSIDVILDDEEKEYTYSIFANDTLGNSRVSEEFSFNATWDCSWIVNPTKLESTIGFQERKSLGNITIINTGDEDYNNECLLDFSLDTKDFSTNYRRLKDVNFRFQDSLREISFSETEFSIKFGESKTIEIEAGFPFTDSNLIENPKIVIESNLVDTVTNSSTREVLAPMVVAPNVALYQEIVNPSTNTLIIPLRENVINLDSYIQNIGGDGSEENTAFNVSSEWDFNENISGLVSGNQKSFYSNLSSNDLQWNNITIDLSKSNLESNAPLTTEEYKFSFISSGFDKYFDFISGGNEDNLFINSIKLVFQCEGIDTDGICPSSCNYETDSACVKPTENPNAGSGGGGGGGSSSSGKQEISEAQFELVNGEISEFQLPIKNKYPEPLTNLKISVTGINSEFIEFPSTIDLIPGNGEVNLTVKITAPAYFQEGNYSLRFRIDGFVQSNTTKSPYSESKLVTLYILDMSRETASSLVEEASNMLEELTNLNLYTKDLEVLLTQLNNNFNLTEFSKLKTNYETFKSSYDSAKESLTILEELRQGIQEAERNGINVFESKKLMLLGEQAMNRGAYQLALERLKEAKLTFAIETKGEFNLLYTIKNNPLESLGILMATLIITTSGTLITRRTLLKRRLKLLKQEQLLLLDLMKIVQRETFELNHMSMEEYISAMNQYEERLQQSVEKEVMTETQLAQLGRVKGKKKALIQEKDRLIDLVRDIQTKYLIKGEMETRIYKNTMKSYTKRLTEVEEALVFLETKEYLRGKR